MKNKNPNCGKDVNHTLLEEVCHGLEKCPKCPSVKSLLPMVALLEGGGNFKRRGLVEGL
jgi:hypothetical protein